MVVGGASLVDSLKKDKGWVEAERLEEAVERSRNSGKGPVNGRKGFASASTESVPVL